MDPHPTQLNPSYMELAKYFAYFRPRERDRYSCSVLGTKDQQIHSTGATRASVDVHWSPLILRRAIVFSFVLLLLCFVIILEIFIHFSSRNAGFPVPSEVIQIVLTYMPMVVLVLVQWVWSTFDLEVKKLAPWKNMFQSFTSAKNSLLLDYIGVDNITMIFAAIRRKQWTVILATTGSCSLALSAVAATSLWIIDSHTILTKPVILERTSGFTTQAFNDVSDATFITRYMANQVFDLPPPKWLQEYYTLSPFRLPDGESHSGTVTAITNAYSGSLDCEEAAASVLVNATSVSQATIAWSGCQHVVDILSPHTRFNPKMSRDIDEALLIGRTYLLECGPTFATALLVAQYRAESDSSPQSLGGVICVPKFTRTTMSITVDASSMVPTESPKTIDKQVDIPLDFGENLIRWLDTSTQFSLDRYLIDDFPYDQYRNADLYELLIAFYGSNCHNPSFIANYSGRVALSTWFHLLVCLYDMKPIDLANSTRVLHHSQALFRSIFPYIFLEAYATPLAEDFSGNRTSIEHRLVNRVVPIRVVQTGLAITAILMVVLHLYHPSFHLYNNPSTQAALLDILFNSPNIIGLLQGTGAIQEKPFSASLEGFKYLVDVNSNIIVTSQDSRSSGSSTKTPTEDSGRPWVPFMLYPMTKVSLGLILFLMMVVLELLCRINAKKGGFIGLDFSESRLFHLWTYVLPGCFFLVGLAISSLDFAIRATQPFVRMSQCPQPLHTLTSNPIYYGSYTILPRSLRDGLYLVSASALAMLLLPASKVAVAGVLTSTMDVTPVYLNLHTLTTFNTSLSIRQPGDLHSMWTRFALTFLPTLGLQHRAWASDTRALASLDLNNTEVSYGTITASLLTIYAPLHNCTRVDPQSLHYNDLGLGHALDFDTTDCEGGLFSMAKIPRSGGYYGGVTAISECPWVLVAFGKFLPAASDDEMITPHALNLTAIQCSTSIALSYNKVTLHINDLTPSVKDVDLEKEEHIINHAPSNAMSMIFVQDELNNDYYDFGNKSEASISAFDPLFRLIAAKNPDTPLDAYLDPIHLENAFREGWSTYWAIYFDRYKRIPVSDREASDITATRTVPTTLLVVNSVPARVLEGLLAIIILLTTTASFLSPRRGVLPKAPFSIGAQMSLLADSSLLCLPTVRQQLREGGLSDVRIRLGWWPFRNPVKEGKWYGIDVVHDDEHDTVERTETP